MKIKTIKQERWVRVSDLLYFIDGYYNDVAKMRINKEDILDYVVDELKEKKVK